jgi:hypothetical protein
MCVRVEIFSRRAFIDGVAALAAIYDVPGRGLLGHFGRGRVPALDVPVTALALIVLECADGLASQERLVSACFSGGRLNDSRFDIQETSFNHRGITSSSRVYYFKGRRPVKH